MRVTFRILLFFLMKPHLK